MLINVHVQNVNNLLKQNVKCTHTKCKKCLHSLFQLFEI